MSRYYRLKTARPLPDTFIPVKLTQPRSGGLTSRVDEGMAWRVAFDHDQDGICVDTESVDGRERVLVDLVDPSDGCVVEIDLEDPVVALQIVRRHSELFPSSSTNQFYVKLNILTGLATDLQRIRCERANGVYHLLLEIDVPASPAKES